MWIGRHFGDNAHVPTGHPKTLISREALPIRLPTWLWGILRRAIATPGRAGAGGPEWGRKGPFPARKGLKL